MVSNRKKAFDVLSQDHECMNDTHTEKGYVTTIKLKDIEYKRDLFCGKCGHKSCWTTSIESGVVPEMTYYCHRCDIVFIFVYDDAKMNKEDKHTK